MRVESSSLVMERQKERLLVLVLCMGLVFTVESMRTHERFSHTTYYANPNSLPTDAPEDVEYTSPVEDGTKIPGKESKEESRKDFIPTEVKQQDELTPEHKGTYTSGDFTADARPWWVNPEYQNYGNSPLGKPSTDRYPSTFDPRYFSNHQRTRGSFSQYLQNQNQVPDNYPQYTDTNDEHDVPYELSDEGCSTEYWISNTHRWPAFFDSKSTIGDAFGTPAIKIFGKTTMLQALLDTHDDGYHSLGRNGCTAILNAYTRHQYKLSHQEVIESFNAALVSNKLAARQAALFDEGNLSALSQQYNYCV